MAARARALSRTQGRTMCPSRRSKIGDRDASPGRFVDEDRGRSTRGTALMTRWMHPQDRARTRSCGIRPITEGSRYRLDRELSFAIWTRACAEIRESAGRRDAERARRQFHELAARIAARGGRLWPDVGRVTGVDIEAHVHPQGQGRAEEDRAR